MWISEAARSVVSPTAPHVTLSPPFATAVRIRLRSEITGETPKAWILSVI